MTKTIEKKKAKKAYKTHAELIRTISSLISAVCGLITVLVVVLHFG